MSHDIRLLEKALTHTTELLGHVTPHRRRSRLRGGAGTRLADLHLLEAVLHGWDLATATGQDRAGDPDTVEAVLRTWYGNHPDEIRSRTGLFGPSRTAPADAPALDRLAAYFGRTV
ncbi:hypothetical protein ACFVRB_10040 [Streptomyces nojiriensis]|uniref:hypothetical protein n=1 Tax=Streptomyces nojiriensis TaxID=66374 RepID=UPI0036DA946A